MSPDGGRPHEVPRNTTVVWFHIRDMFRRTLKHVTEEPKKTPDPGNQEQRRQDFCLPAGGLELDPPDLDHARSSRTEVCNLQPPSRLFGFGEKNAND